MVYFLVVKVQFHCCSSASLVCSSAYSCSSGIKGAALLADTDAASSTLYGVFFKSLTVFIA